MPPSSPTTDTKLILRYTFPAPREKIFKAWTNVDEVKKWFAPGAMIVAFAEIDLTIGGKYRIGMQDDGNNKLWIITGNYTEIRPPEKLVFTWRKEDYPNENESLVSIEFRDKGKETEILLVHDLNLTVEERDSHNKGWIGCLENLRKAL